VLHRVALPLIRALLQFEREGFVGFASAYARRDLLAGRAIVALDPAHPEASVAGVAEGVGRHGALLLRRGDGSLAEIRSGEVSVRPQVA
jgi:BirA family biotin operon repressor/biotin-[acetyl-CoA-carboxylase] ligase